MAHRRGNGEGSVYKVADGYRAVITLPDGTRKYFRGRTRKAAADKLASALVATGQGLPTGPTDTLTVFLRWWLSTVEARATANRKSVNTADNARWAVERWILPSLGSKRLRDLTPSHVEAMLAKMADAGRSHRTVSRVRSYLAQALSVAERRGYVARNVARLAELPQVAPPAEKRTLTPAEAQAVLKAAQGHRLEGLVVCALMLGLRPGELCGLRWGDVDMDAGTLSVLGSLKQERGQRRLGETKTGKTRTIRLPRPVVEALIVHQFRQGLERKECGEGWANSDLVFTTTIGTPLDRWNLRRAVRALCEQAGVPLLSPNELGRHSAASLLYDAGVSLDQIADLLGHSSLRMLTQHYRHRITDAVGSHVESMESLFGAQDRGGRSV